MRLDAGGGQNGVRTRRCSPFPFVTYYLTRAFSVRHGFRYPYGYVFSAPHPRLTCQLRISPVSYGSVPVIIRILIRK
jgi:hypothetical protein